ncbi:hypothetical protein EVAR_33020_1 [Eumeta japonica]|uniref:Uncharacterized protein n=1 Tax=Eumeta variegata TaxID=151549 RepID=A0A4C1VSE5_EUMVA|nr:hypothetical protein EVAR_33020_1 [Eumeta japonica]
MANEATKRDGADLRGNFKRAFGRSPRDPNPDVFGVGGERRGGRPGEGRRRIKWGLFLVPLQFSGRWRIKSTLRLRGPSVENHIKIRVNTKIKTAGSKVISPLCCFLRGNNIAKHSAAPSLDQGGARLFFSALESAL